LIGGTGEWRSVLLLPTYTDDAAETVGSRDSMAVVWFVAADLVFSGKEVIVKVATGERRLLARLQKYGKRTTGLFTSSG
jgi:hypothetical protein